jgi:hypothetical protein
VRRSSTLKRGAPLKRTQFRTWSRLDSAARDEWRRQVVRGNCVMCGRADCRPLDPHHVVPAQRLRRYVKGLRLPPEEAATVRRRLLFDPRNGIPVGRRCHENHENGHARIPRLLLPSSAEEFARELGLEYVLDRLYV